ncbi:MAG: hypothetical protein KatS3mg126_1675 [Lysobacteraceae bacterium]|nr:MAG: hypothetical protein KatS3mg126_1675 [Xanthomonadaceae bacterium]
MPRTSNLHPSFRHAAGLVCLGVLLLGGCVLGRGPEAQRIAVADTPSAAVQDGPQLAFQLEIGEPEVLALLDDARILVRDPEGRYARLAGARLPDRAPRWLQTVLLDAVARWPFAAVTLPGSGVRSDLRLQTYLQELQLDYRGRPEARVALHAMLVEGRTGRVLARQAFAQAGDVGGQGRAAAVDALADAATRLAEELARWAAESAREVAVEAPQAEPVKAEGSDGRSG